MPNQTPEQLGMVAKAIKLTAKSLGVKIDDDILDIWLCELAPDSHVAVMNAIRSCLRECKPGRLALADILERIAGRPLGSDAAWNMAIKARVWDDSQTFVIIHAIVAAFPYDLWGSGDRIGARMAFRDSYNRHIQTPEGKELQSSLGWDADGRETPIREAVTAGLLAPEAARRLLPMCDFTDCAKPKQTLISAKEVFKENPRLLEGQGGREVKHRILAVNGHPPPSPERSEDSTSAMHKEVARRIASQENGAWERGLKSKAAAISKATHASPPLPTDKQSVLVSFNALPPNKYAQGPQYREAPPRPIRDIEVSGVTA